MSARIPPMPDGFTDATAWAAIHWRFSPGCSSVLDDAVRGWQLDNQERVKAAIRATERGVQDTAA